MAAKCIRHTDLPKTSRLFADFIYHFDRVASFYAHPPDKPDSFRAAAKEIDYPAERRAALVAALREQNGASPELDLLAQPGTVAVVTGQQVGLFSGPAYTVYKAITAAKLARTLSQTGIPAVPVFWLATEDHDLAEVNHCWVFDARKEPAALRASGQNAAGQPVGTIELRDVPLDALRAALRDFPFGDHVTQLVADCYTPGSTFGAAFTALLKQLLASFGLLFLDPLQPAIRRLAAPMLREAVTVAPELKRLVMERNAELAAAGYHAQVHIEPESSLVFLLENGRRLALKYRNGEYVTRDRRFSAEALGDQAERISPNALLRPVVQDYLLPTVAYIGGPAELAYMAQAQPIYRVLLGRMPVITPRAGFTLLDARAVKLTGRYELSLADFFEDQDAFERRIGETLIPPAVPAAFRETEAAIEHQIARLGVELVRFDSTLAAALDTSRVKMLYQLAKTGRKIARESLRRDQRATADARWLLNLVYPHQHLQERLYTILPFLAQHGLDLPARLYENVRMECPDHILLSL